MPLQKCTATVVVVVVAAVVVAAVVVVAVDIVFGEMRHQLVGSDRVALAPTMDLYICNSLQPDPFSSL